MVASILAILKWPGIILLCLLAFVLVLLLCILFVPVRYRIHFCSENESVVTGNVSWLLHLLHVTVGLRDKSPDITVRVFGIPLAVGRDRSGREKKSSEKKPEKPKNRKRQTNGEKEEGEETGEGFTAGDALETENPPEAEEVGREDLQSGEAGREDGGEKKQEDLEAGKNAAVLNLEIDETIVEKKNFFQKIHDFFLSIREKSATIKNKVLKMTGAVRRRGASGAEEGKASKILKLVRDKNTGQLLDIVWKQVIFLWKYIRPSQVKGWIRFGMSDPCLTGQLLGAVAILFAIRGESFTVIPDFERAVLEEDLAVKGRLRLVIVVIIALRVLLSSNWRRFKKQMDRL